MKKKVLVMGPILASLALGWCPLSFAGDFDVDPRENAVDLAVGGMQEGSRPLSPEAGGNQVPGSGLSPGMDTRVTASAPARGVSVAGPMTADGGTPGGGSEEEQASEPVGGSDDTSIVDAGVDADLSGGGTGANLDDAASGLEGDSDRSIVEADATVDTSGSGPIIDADASLDTSAEGGLIDADASAAADVVDQELTSESGLEVDLTADTTIAESSLGNEIGTSPAPASTEADAGLEADVEATGSGDDVASDPADGLSSDIPSL